jgi:hypothetical protein
MSEPTIETLPLTCSLFSTTKRKNLLFVRSAFPSAFDGWYLPGEKRSWDLMMSYYRLPINNSIDAEYITAGGISKFSSVKDLFSDNSGLFSVYDYIWIMDDDIEIKFSDVDKFFCIMKEFRLSIAQPALTSDSFCSWPICFKVKDSGLRFTNFVEVMMPAFSQEAFRRCSVTFDKSISSWGLDYVWRHILPDTRKNIAIVDSIEARHTRPIDTTNGAFYRHLAKFGVNPAAEWRYVQKMFDCSAVAAATYDRIHPLVVQWAVSKGDDFDGLRVVVHSREAGDLTSESDGYAGMRGEAYWIEGFSLLPGRGIPSNALMYRALFVDGTLGAPTMGGQYCGTRGERRPLAGFAVELGTALQAKCVCTYSAQFSDGSEAGPFPAGTVCRSETGALLQRMRVEFSFLSPPAPAVADAVGASGLPAK